MGFDPRRFDEAMARYAADPEILYREVVDRMTREKGAAWVEENGTFLRADFEAARHLLGL